MPKTVLNCVLTPSQGKYSFDPVSRILVWDVGRVDPSKLPNLRGSVSQLFLFLFFSLFLNIIKKNMNQNQHILHQNNMIVRKLQFSRTPHIPP